MTLVDSVHQFRIHAMVYVSRIGNVSQACRDLGIVLIGARTVIFNRAIDQMEILSDLKVSQINTWISQGKDAVLLASRLHETQRLAHFLGMPGSGKLIQETAASYYQRTHHCSGGPGKMIHILWEGRRGYL